MKDFITGFITVLFFTAIISMAAITSAGDKDQKKNKVPPDSPIVVYGDSRSNPEVHKKIINCILPFHPKAVFHTGDLVFNGKSDAQWNVFNSVVADLIKVAPIYPAIGNHELETLMIQQDLELPNEGKWYSIDVNNIHFIMLDVVADYTQESVQYKWLINDLKSRPAQTEFTAVLTHYPFYSTGARQTDTAQLHGILEPVFKEYQVDIVFSGHHHCYERCFSDGIWYITTAGGGAPLYPQKNEADFSQLYVKTYHFCTLDKREDSLFVTAIDTNLAIIDRFYLLR